MALQHPAAGERRIDRTGSRATRALLVVACAIGVSAHARASAQEFAAREVGDWTVAASSDDTGCFLTRAYDRPGGTTLILGLDGDGTNHLSVLNANWSIKPKDQLSLDFRFSKGGYAKHGAIGMAADGKRGFVTTFEAKFPAYFAASKVLEIFRGDVPVEQLGLEQSGAAVAALRDCVAVRSAPRAAEPPAKARGTRIPVDPFASDPPRKRKR
ncbi:hypothetical protein [Sphingomonas ginsenosidivorax]|uniref:hypothetical protein n=1 Tax=Sphingomonas ginsenosidivorax TaxID=862135 RepID=UPI001F55516A|nr:hypothetical protein [Sphingomonas ginsenosidivorax]